MRLLLARCVCCLALHDWLCFVSFSSMNNDTSKVNTQNPDESDELKTMKRHASESLASELLASSEDFGNMYLKLLNNLGMLLLVTLFRIDCCENSECVGSTGK